MFGTQLFSSLNSFGLLVRNFLLVRLKLSFMLVTESFHGDSLSLLQMLLDGFKFFRVTSSESL